MTKEDAVEIVSEIRSDYNFFNTREEPEYRALSMAIKALKAQRFAKITIATDIDWFAKQVEIYKEGIYLNEQTMIVYVPLVTAELIASIGGTINRVGEEEQ